MISHWSISKTAGGSISDLMAPHAEILGTFNCQGEVNPKILEKASAKASPPVWLKDAPDAKGHPDDKDLDALSNAVNQCLKNIVEGV